jgi:hypothetical protein
LGISQPVFDGDAHGRSRGGFDGALLSTVHIPPQTVLQAMICKPITCIAKEDHAACIAAVTKGYPPSPRYLKWTQHLAFGPR